MKRPYILIATFLGLAACATTGPQAPEPGADTENSATRGNTTTGVGEEQVADKQDMPKVAGTDTRNEIVCQMERKTGTNRKKRVCRSRAQIEKSSRDGKEAFEVLRRGQVDTE